MTASIKTYRLDGTSTSIVFASDGDMIDLIYFGPALPEKEDLTVLAAISQFGSHENQPENVTVGGLLPEVRNGFSGKPALKIRQGVTSVDTCFELLDVTCTEDRLVATWKDCVCQVQVSAIWQACDSDVFKCHYRLSNKGNEVIFLEAVPSLVLPLPAHFTELTSFPGRWAREMQATRHQLGPSMIEMRSSGGKPGFDPGNWLIFHSNIDSSILGCHLAWNGDHIALAARDRDGQATVHLEATLDRNAADLVPGGA
jgi:alpha-galactosidase